MILDEHDAMQVIIKGLREAGEGAAAMARFRPDQPWSALDATFKVCANSAWKLAEESVRKVVKS